MATESNVDRIVSGLKGLTLEDQAEVKSLLDARVRGESSTRAHPNYHSIIQGLTVPSTSYSLDITLLDAFLKEE